MRFFLRLGALCCLALASCGDSAETGGGGSAGSEQGGAGGDGGATPEGGSGGGTGGLGGGECVDSPLTTTADATDEAFTDEPACAVVGLWALAFEQTMDFSPVAMSVGVDSETGRLVVESDYVVEATATEDGCTLDVSWSRSDFFLEDGNCFGCIAQLDASFTLTGAEDEVTGTYSYSEVGDCGNETTGTVTATRTVP